MNRHFKNVQYLWSHKKYVWVAGRKLGVTRRRLLLHDRSKLGRVEWRAYSRYFNEQRTRDVKDDFARAWLHHVNRNDHHWQHWCAIRRDGTVEALQMPEAVAREMVADWAGAGRAIQGHWELQEWYAEHGPHQVLHPRTRRLVESLIPLAPR